MKRAGRNTGTFSELYRRTYPDVLAFLLRRCSSAEDAADCLAETYLWRGKSATRCPPVPRPDPGCLVSLAT
jgi:DNA-directed RNA polymerase specialized sigma24 family protein